MTDKTPPTEATLTMTVSEFEAFQAQARAEALDAEVLRRAINESGEWPMVQGIDSTGATAIVARYRAILTEQES